MESPHDVTAPLKATAAPRARAPKRQGHRTQLTVPSGVWKEARKLARELRTTPNDVVVRLAEVGLGLAQRERDLQRLAGERRDAYARAHGAVSGEWPAAEEVEEAALRLRRESEE